MTRSAHLPRTVALCFALLCLSACSLRTYALRSTADALSGTGGVMGEDDDPDFVRDAAPFGLKTMEALRKELPDHKGLALALASGFTQYAYAFVHNEADQVAEKDLKRGGAIALRARRLYLRARDYALAGLEISHRGIHDALRRGDAATRDAALRRVETKDVPLLYWAASSWGLAVSTAKDNPDLIGDLPAIESIMARALQLDETYDRGAIHEFYVTYDASRSKEAGGGPESVRRHLQRAQALSGGKRLGGLVSYAEGLLVNLQDRAEFTKVLNQVLATDVYADDESWRRERLANIVAQDRARWLLSRTEDLFAN